jgi:hypothetical protein
LLDLLFPHAYFNDHMARMMESMDLQHTGDKTNGFQSNQMAIRFYLMNVELEYLKARWSVDTPAFADFRDSIRHGGALTDEEIAAQTIKANRFIGVAMELNNKHFHR